MMKNSKSILAYVLLLMLISCRGNNTTEQIDAMQKNLANNVHSHALPLVRLKTNLGEITIELYPKQAPLTVENFIKYVDENFYDQTVFHRVVPGFVVQGGGFSKRYNRKQTNPPIKNESYNGLKNMAGTLSMARTMDPHSATSQFFINLKDNATLDDKPGRPGYAVFGKVIEGFDIVQNIASIPRGQVPLHPEAPNESVILEDAEVVNR